MEFREIERMLKKDSRFKPGTSAYGLIEASLRFGRLSGATQWDPFYLLSVLVGDTKGQIATQFAEKFAFIGVTPTMTANLLLEDGGNPEVVEAAARSFFDLVRKLHEDRRGPLEGTDAILLPRDSYSSGELVTALLISFSPRVESTYQMADAGLEARLRAFGVRPGTSWRDQVYLHVMNTMMAPA